MKDFGQIPIGSEHLYTLFIDREQSSWTGKSGQSRTIVRLCELSDLVKGAVKNNIVFSGTSLCVASISHLSKCPCTVWNLLFIWLSTVSHHYYITINICLIHQRSFHLLSVVYYTLSIKEIICFFRLVFVLFHLLLSVSPSGIYNLLYFIQNTGHF